MPSRSTLQKLCVSGFLFLSGAAALIYELVWSKYLGNVLGNSGQAHAVVLATFMGGLALGAFIFGRAADKARSPLRLYAVLELGIGVYALAFKPVLDLLGRAYLAVAPGIPDGPARLAAKLVLAALALVVPTILMGGTLPPLVRHLTSNLSGVKRELARLYAVNSLGAAMGAFVAGVALVPAIGLAASTRFAAGANLFIALAALVLSRVELEREADEDSDDSRSYPLRAVRVALWGSALSGFSAMVCQISWIRLLALVLGASTYAFTLILTAFILGIGLGSLWLSRARTGDLLRLFGLLQAGIALTVCLALPLYLRMPFYLWRFSDALSHSVTTWPLYQGFSFFLCCVVLLVPTALMGASFPAVARVATAKVSEVGRQLGGVYLWNTAGTILGSLLGGLWLMPAFTLEGAFAIAVAVNIVSAALSLWAAPTTSDKTRALLPSAIATAAALIFFVGSAGWSSLVSNAGTFRDARKPPADARTFLSELKASTTTEFHRDDTFASVIVGKAHPDEIRYLRINGKADASDSADMDTQIMLGQLGPMLHAREVKRALVIGLGSGVTVGSLLTHGVERVDVVEISPGVVEAARYFDHVNGKALDDPRVKVHIDDARTFMLLEGATYDVIVSEPSNPWVAGVSSLFTREFFQLARDHLNDDGLLVQWMHLYETDQPIVKLVVRTLRDTFPYGTSWMGRLDMIMVSGKQPMVPDPEKLAARLRSEKVKADLARIHADGVAPFLSLQVHSSDGQLAFAGSGEINSEDRNDLEYDAPIAFFLRLPPVPVHDERRGPDGGAKLAITAWLKTHALTADEARAMHAALLSAGYPADPLVRAAAERWQKLAPEDREALRALAIAAAAQKDFANARPLLERLHVDEKDPELAAAIISVTAEEQSLRAAAWNALTLDVTALAREALRLSPNSAVLNDAVDQLCRGVAREACLARQPVAGGANE